MQINRSIIPSDGALVNFSCQYKKKKKEEVTSVNYIALVECNVLDDVDAVIRIIPDNCDTANTFGHIESEGSVHCTES